MTTFQDRECNLRMMGSAKTEKDRQQHLSVSGRRDAMIHRTEGQSVRLNQQHIKPQIGVLLADCVRQ